jgi:hypothetical protein
MEPQPGRALSVKDWSATAGANPSKIIDLLVSCAVNVAAVLGAVLLFATEPVWSRVVGAVLLALATGVVGWLLRREVARHSPLLTAYAGSRLVLLLGVAAAYLVRRPDQAGWIWAAGGVALLAVLTEPIIKVLLSRTEPVAVNLPGVRPVPAPRSGRTCSCPDRWWRWRSVGSWPCWRRPVGSISASSCSVWSPW